MIETPGRLRADSSSFSSPPIGDQQDPAGGLERVEVADQLARLGARRATSSSTTLIAPSPNLAVSAPCSARRFMRLGRLLLVAARMRAEDHAAAGVVRCAARALAGAAGALLAVRLGAAAADLAARLGVVRAGPAAGELGRDRLVHARSVDLDVEQRLGQVDRADLGARLASRGSWSASTWPS